MPYTFQQDRSKRENRTIVEVDSAMMHYNANLEEILWAELLNTATQYLIEPKKTYSSEVVFDKNSKSSECEPVNLNLPKDDVASNPVEEIQENRNEFVESNPDGAKGFRQKKGVGFEWTFCRLAKLSTVRTLISIAANEERVSRQFDISTAFLYGHLDEQICITQPEDYNDNSGLVCSLKMSVRTKAIP
ncbi:hypothetical protein ILUMI_09012 [Ignelater luminosus]|uniref:Reverse transcriptase Ty1/copia-type domain-containing protein n=1 Tax=Ignelater luminosus TaxID=2038154 RepID=A0A8K0GGG1_IGNLU|nr:hypothetical protein ILUMI_09012 [Ignelater luminosus]